MTVEMIAYLLMILLIVYLGIQLIDKEDMLRSDGAHCVKIDGINSQGGIIVEALQISVRRLGQTVPAGIDMLCYRQITFANQFFRRLAAFSGTDGTGEALMQTPAQVRQGAAHMREDRLDVRTALQGAAIDQISSGAGGIEAEFLNVIYLHKFWTRRLCWRHTGVNVDNGLSFFQLIK